MSPWIDWTTFAEYIETIDLGELEYVEAEGYDDDWKPLGNFLGFVEKTWRGNDKKGHPEVWLSIRAICSQDGHFWWYLDESRPNPDWHHVCAGVRPRECKASTEANHIAKWRFMSARFL